MRTELSLMGLFRLARRAGRTGLFCALWTLTGCGTTAATAPAPQPSASAASDTGTPGRDRILAIYHSRCGACHRPVPPGSEPADRLDAALARHHKRAHLTEQEWDGLGRFLAAH